jgi:hypothetical protein
MLQYVIGIIEAFIRQPDAFLYCLQYSFAAGVDTPVRNITLLQCTLLQAARYNGQKILLDQVRNITAERH